MAKNRDTSSTGVLNMLFEGIAILILKALLIGGAIGAVIVGAGFLIFR
jgi:hypothetical protein